MATYFYDPRYNDSPIEKDLYKEAEQYQLNLGVLSSTSQKDSKAYQEFSKLLEQYNEVINFLKPYHFRSRLQMEELDARLREMNIKFD